MSAKLCLLLFLFLGFTASYQDWRHRKIRNRLILRGLGAGGALLGLLFLNSVLGHLGLRLGRIGEFYFPWGYYPRVALHVALSFAAAFGLWRWSVWPAGDAKLFTLFSLLIVIIDPNLPGFPGFLFLLLLINIFVPAGLVLGAESALKLALKAGGLRRFEARKWGKARLETAGIRLRELWPYRLEYAVLAINLFALFFGLQAAQARFVRGLGAPLGPLAAFLFVFVFWRLLIGVLKNKAVGALALAGLCAWTLAGTVLWHWDIAGRLWTTMKMTCSFGMLLSMGSFVFDWIIERESLRALRTEELALGSVLSNQTWDRLAAEKELSGKLARRCVDGLTEEDASALRTWLAGRAPGDYTVYQTIPFAVWIFLGSLLTVSGCVNVMAVLTPWFGRVRALLAAGAGRLFS